MLLAIYITITSSCGRVGKVPRLILEVSRSSRLCRLPSNGAYRKYFLTDPAIQKRSFLQKF